MKELKINGIYRHFKGDYYIVEGIGIHSETKEKYVIYKALYGDNETYLRPYEMFLEKVDKVKYPNVKQEYRFQLQDIESIAKKFKGE
ncbi:MAG: DUF1653 domain-containing protein [Clostridia bacterium]|nr:DUF1653 domain-containing protein [Clostridia bacterium]